METVKFNINAFRSTPVFVIGHGDCTTTFQSGLGKSECLADSNAVCNSERDSYWQFKQNLLATSPLDFEVRQNIWEKYVAGLLSTEKPFSMLAMDFGSLSELDGAIPNPAETPAIVRWLETTGCPVVHLVRSKPLDCLIEQLVNESLQLNGNGSSNPDLNLSAAISRVAEIRAEVAQVRQWLAPLHRTEFYFESLFDSSGRFSKGSARQLAKLLGVESRQLEVNGFNLMSHRQPVALQLKRQLRPAMTRAGYENLFNLPKAA